MWRFSSKALKVIAVRPEPARYILKLLGNEDARRRAGHDDLQGRVHLSRSLRGRMNYATDFSTIRLPSSSTESPVLRASVTTDACQSTLPASGPPTTAIKSASGLSETLRNPR